MVVCYRTKILYDCGMNTKFQLVKENLKKKKIKYVHQTHNYIKKNKKC